MRAESMQNSKLYSCKDTDMKQVLKTVAQKVSESVAKADQIHRARLASIHVRQTS